MEFLNQEIEEIWLMLEKEIRRYAQLILTDGEKAKEVVNKTEHEMKQRKMVSSDVQSIVLDIRKVFWAQVVQFLSDDQKNLPIPAELYKEPLDEMIREAIKELMECGSLKS